MSSAPKITELGILYDESERAVWLRHEDWWKANNFAKEKFPDAAQP
jgi:hypothetical protein